MIYTSHSLEETQKLSESFVGFVKQNPTFNTFGFSGDLGSGKTAFTKCVASLLGITEHITSPTFVIQKKYSISLEGFPFKTLIHIDSYRLENGGELNTLHFQEELENPENLIIIEWPEKVEDALPKDLPILQFSFVDEHTRTIAFPAIMEA